MTYAFGIERGPKSLWAQVPDLAGCVAVGESRAEVCGQTREAIEVYFEALGRPLHNPVWLPGRPSPQPSPTGRGSKSSRGLGGAGRFAEVSLEGAG